MKKTPILDRKYSYILVSLYFVVVTIIFTRPLLNKITTHTVGSYADNFYFLWQIEWIKRAVFDLKIMPLTSNLLNFPYGYSLLITEISPLQIGFAIPFALLGQPVLGYNISMLMTFVVAGLTMYFWVFSITNSKWAGLISGTAYAFVPYHIAHFMLGHLNISGIQWFPLYFWGFSSILIKNKFSWKNVFLFSTGLSAIALTSLYYTYMTIIISGIIFVIYLLFIDRGKFFSKEIWRQFIFGVFISAPFVAIGIGPYIYFHGSRGTSRAIEEAVIFSASITDFLLPFTKQAILGKWVWRNFPRDLWNEATLYLGIPITVLSLTWLKKKKPNVNYRNTQLFVIGGITAFILALGTNMTWLEKPVWINVPEWLRGITGKDKSLIYLPGYLLYKFLPFYTLMRVPMRYGIFVMLFNCALAGLGTNLLLMNMKGYKRKLIRIGLLFLIITDFYNTPFQFVDFKPREVDLWLANMPIGGLVYIPFEQSNAEESVYYTLHNNKPLLGIIRAFPSDRFLYLNQVLRDFPSNSSIDALHDENITYILVDQIENPIENGIEQIEDQGLNYEGSFSGYFVFTIAK